MAHLLPTTTLHIVDILNDCKVHTGTDIAETLGISRTAVWKVIQRLKKYNIAIQSQHQGYQLNFPLFLLEKEKIENFLKDSRITLEVFESISSTNDYLRNKSPLKNLHFCLAEYQTKGRGRLGRSWISPFGRSIYCSFSYIFNKDMSEMSGLSLMIGIAVANALESLSPEIKPLLKWPNDIYVQHKKGGGILIDLIAEAHGNCKAIIGFGLNINMQDVTLEGIDQPWSSLEHTLHIKMDRNFVVARIIQYIVKSLDVFLDQGLAPFLSEWSRYDLLKDQKISINTQQSVISGTAKGIDDKGFLRLELPSKDIEKFSYGDTILLKH
ncbi:MAG: biotin--[acetyl-CoA-carboxylase] ligase [Alphaproteobacteria bacterium]|nr:biotin--[acetyl-CoA-carboxylase] ligase [Alphaproteobacteria bacterium]